MTIDLNERFKKAVSLLETGKTHEDFTEAEDIFNGLLNLDREAPALLLGIAGVFARKKYNALAIILLKYLLEKNLDMSDAWNNLGCLYRADRINLPESIEAFKKALEFSQTDKDKAIALGNLGSCYVAHSEAKKAIEYLSQAIKLDDTNPHTFWNRSLAYLELGDYMAGWQDYESGVRTTDRMDRNYHNEGTPKWDGETGKTVVVYGEQGIGDEIMFASILPDMMKDCRVILDAHPRLYQLFRNSFPGIPVYGTRKDSSLHWAQFHQIDARIPIGSLGKFYRHKKENFPGVPFLKADKKITDKYIAKLAMLGEKIKIGISWKGGTKETNMHERNIKLEQWLPLFKAIDADFISLQYHADAQEQLDKFEKQHNIHIHHWQDTIDDYDETAGLVSLLDYIVSVPQSVVHLAGALGANTIQLTPKHAMWQMGVYGEDMPWYKSVKNIWQDESCTWEPVIKQATEELCKNLSAKTM